MFLPSLGAPISALLLYIFWALYSGFLSPLSAIPNAHPLSPFTKLWLLYLRYTGREHRTRYLLHKKLGPVIRLGPQELSVNCIEDGVRTIYAGDFDRSPWFDGFNFYDNQPFMFKILPSAVHAERKRMMAPVYSKSSIQNSYNLDHCLNVILLERFIPRIEVWAAEKTPVAIHIEDQAIAIDITSSYLFGLRAGSNFVEDAKTRDHFITAFTQSINGIFWQNEFPRMTKWLRWLGIHLVPDSVHVAQKTIERVCMNMCENVSRAVTEKNHDPDGESCEDGAVVYHQLLPKLEAQHGKSSSAIDKLIAAEMLDHLIAGNDGLGNTLTFLFWELSCHLDVQQRLRAELDAADEPGPCSPAIDSLPLLDAILMETMRLHPAGLGPHLRVVPREGTRLGQYDSIPGGTTVSATAWALHRNETVYPEPEKWKPERWMDESRAKNVAMLKWFFAFGAGGRKCIGNYLAIKAMKAILSAVYSRFETKLAVDSEFAQADGHMGRPTGKPLMLLFTKLEV